MGPITWRNINAPNFSDSNRFAIQSGEQIGRGLDLLSKAASGYRQGELDTQNQQRDFQTQEFINRINSFNDIDNYGNFQRQISSELARLNPSQVNLNEVNTALQGRDNTLRTDLLQQQEFADSQAAIAARPDSNAVRLLAAQGNFDEATQKLGSSTTIADKAPLIQMISDARDKAREEEFTLNERARTLDLRNQNNIALGIRNNALQNVDDPTNLEDYVQGQLQDAGVTDPQIISNTVSGLQDAYNERNGLTKDQTESLANAQSVHASVIDSANEKIQIMKDSAPTYSDDLGHYLDTSTTTSSAIKYVVEQSEGEVPWYVFGDLAEMTGNAVKGAKDKLLITDGLKDVFNGPEGEQLLNAATKYAKDFGGKVWEKDGFQDLIVDGFKILHSRYTLNKEHEKNLLDLVLKRDTLQNEANKSLRLLKNEFTRSRRQGQ
ncbi:MAG: hypothetical protein AXW14_08915 [Alteromonas sp. Nap_26]|nr:MAG: hypothetical protein AXW14_08915 [Alteromonas sp. Nap_26]